MKRYYLTVYKQFPKVTYYTVVEEGKENNETDQFFLRFRDKEKNQKDVQTIKYWLEKIGKEKGALERFFRPERKATAIPIPPPQCDLRLYCHRISDDIVILGGGGEKTSKKVKDSPDALPHFDLMNLIAAFVNSRLQKGQLYTENGKLVGSLKFTTRN